MQNSTTAHPQGRILDKAAIAFIAAYAIFTRAGGHFDRQCWARNARHVVLALGLLSGLQVGAEGVGAGNAGDASWKEEVLLHDGHTIVVERSQSYRGRFEPGSSAPIGEHTVRFMLPRGQREWRWTSEYGPELGRTNFTLVAIHAKDGVPYIVTTPNLCLSYNKWGRPNPPYVLFKGEDNGQWARISMEQLPAEFTTINVAVDVVSHYNVKQFQAYAVAPAAKVREFNSDLRSPENKSIVREPLPQKMIIDMCGDMVPYKGRWVLRNDPVAREWIDREDQERSKKQVSP